MKVVIGLLVLLTIAMLVGVVRKLRGDTFLPGPGRAGVDHTQDRQGRWWRHEERDNTFEEVFRRPTERK